MRRSDFESEGLYQVHLWRLENEPEYRAYINSLRRCELRALMRPIVALRISACGLADAMVRMAHSCRSSAPPRADWSVLSGWEVA